MRKFIFHVESKENMYKYEKGKSRLFTFRTCNKILWALEYNIHNLKCVVVYPQKCMLCTYIYLK